MIKTDNATAKLTGTAILAALVLVFDYSLKYSGLKIPFPWYPNLKFDFTGVPIALCLLLYGLPSSIVTGLVAGLGIFARSGNFLSATLKSVAELSTVLGMAFGMHLLRDRVEENRGKASIILSGTFSRVLVMTAVNLYVLPTFYGVPISVTYGLLPLIGLFNIAQGLISILLGIFLDRAIRDRLGVSSG